MRPLDLDLVRSRLLLDGEREHAAAGVDENGFFWSLSSVDLISLFSDRSRLLSSWRAQTLFLQSLSSRSMVFSSGLSVVESSVSISTNSSSAPASHSEQRNLAVID